MIVRRINGKKIKKLLYLLSRVIRMKESYGRERQVLYLNLVEEIKNSMKMLDYSRMFDDSAMKSI